MALSPWERCFHQIICTMAGSEIRVPMVAAVYFHTN
jgi:hypothetical protein